ncbi:MAG: 2-polyprenyl-3-methyl-5-hydroxy-6-metoxy-1,4-benzoquinol methylase [Arenicella sp.]|jgi:2-polyprenyl-3-methyl-5-hydroxy-6-metoxy-1,4-benzoquinol methylase
MSDSKVAEYWGNSIETNFTGETFWLANPTIKAHFDLKLSNGEDYGSWVNYTVGKFLDRLDNVDKILSIGCGNGELERHLAQHNTAKAIEAIDIAPKCIAACEQAATNAGLNNTLKYYLANVETNPLPSENYHAIYFNSSLHHMSNLDSTLAKCNDALDPEGYLFVNEYIGPNRFAFSSREKAVMQSLFTLIPEKYRVSNSKPNVGKVRHEISLPTPKQVIDIDPSEAIHSQEISAAIERHFHVVQINYSIGTVMQFLLADIIGNFSEDDSEGIRILEMIIETEETLVSTRDLQPHFALFIATKKQ